MAHNHCHHSFKFCAQCDLVYCTSCHRDWGGHRHSYNPYWSTQPWWTGTAMDDTLTTGGTTNDPTVTIYNGPPVTDTVVPHNHN